MTNKTIARKQAGCRTVAGTDWPIYHLVQREQYGLQVTWRVVHGMCNGTANRSSTHKTLRAAMAAFEKLPGTPVEEPQS